MRVTAARPPAHSVTGGGGITYEKNCTLAIALCLRADLESCGAKVS